MTLSIQTNAEPKPPRILIYGVAGIGKTSFGALAPNPVFLQTEDGLGKIDIPHFPLAKSFQDIMGYLTELAAQDHNYKTLVIDSVGWMEPLVWKKIIEERPKNEKGVTVKNIEDYGFGKGYLYVLDLWKEYIQAINWLRDNKNMMIIQVAHAQVKKFNNPETEAYDRYEIKLQVNKEGKGASPLLQEHSDIVLFANYPTFVKSEDVGFGNERKRAMGAGDRYLYTQERPAFVAKNRYGLPFEIPFDKEGVYWSVLAQHVPYLTKLLGE